MGDNLNSIPDLELYIDDPPIMRKKIIEWRKSLPFEERQIVFDQICNKFYSSDLYQNAKKILAYHGKISSGEFDTSSLLDHILHDGKQLLLPKVNTSEFGLQIYHVRDLENDLKPGSYGLIEPDPKQCFLVDFSMIDLIIVPGLVFDLKGYRYGYGKGYYDWLLNMTSQFHRITVAFIDNRLLLNKCLKIHVKDRPVNFIFTDKKIQSI